MTQRLSPVPRDHQIVTLAMQGMLIKDIALQVGAHRNTVTNVLKRPEVQRMLRATTEAVEQRLVADLTAQLDAFAPEALARLVDLMRTGPPGIALKAAESILDRSSTAPKRTLHSKQEVHRESVAVQFTPADMAQMAQTLREANAYTIEGEWRTPDPGQ